MPFVPPATALRVGCLVSGSQTGLGRGLASGPEGLGDGGGVCRIRHAAEALLGGLVKGPGSGMAKGQGGGGGGRLLVLCTGWVILAGVVCLGGGAEPASRPTQHKCWNV